MSRTFFIFLKNFLIDSSLSSFQDRRGSKQLAQYSTGKRECQAFFCFFLAFFSCIFSTPISCGFLFTKLHPAVFPQYSRPSLETSRYSVLSCGIRFRDERESQPVQQECHYPMHQLCCFLYLFPVLAFRRSFIRPAASRLQLYADSRRRPPWPGGVLPRAEGSAPHECYGHADPFRRGMLRRPKS